MPGNTATIKLKADSRGIVKGTDDLKKLDRQAGKTEKGTKDLSKSFARMGKVAGVAVVALGAVFARAVIKNTIAQDDAVAQLNSTLRSTGRFTEEASQALRDHAAALQQVSVFGDEAIIAAQSQLLTFKQLGGEVLPRTTQAVLDLSVKMGQDLRSSVVQLGKALNDPVANLGALGRVGIQFSTEQKALIKTLAETNRLAEAQAIILDELESEFGGSAKAARDTLGGAIEVLKNNFGDLLEVSGDGSTGVTGSLNELAETLAKPEIKQGFQTLAVGVLEFASALAHVPAFSGFVIGELRELFGRISQDDVVRITERIDELKVKLKEVQAGTFISHLRDAFGGDTEADIKIEIVSLQNLLKARKRLNDASKPKTVAEAAGDVADTVDPVDDGEEGPSEAEKEAAAKAEIQRLKDRKTATDSLRDSLREFAAEQGGPVVEAQQRYEDAIAATDEAEKELLATGGITKEQEAELQEIRESALITRQQTIDLIAAEAAEKAALLTPTEQLIEDLEFENSLIGMNNVEREKAIALKGIEGEATEAQKTKIGELITSQNELMEQQQLMNELGGSLANNMTNAFTDMATGSKSAKEAFGDMAKAMLADIARIIIQTLVMRALGVSGGGNAPGVGLLGSLFGPGRASGGHAMAGQPQIVGEIGPEIFIPKTAGTIVTNQQASNVTPINKHQQTTQNITVNLPPSIRRDTANQAATETARVLKRQSARNR